MKEIRISVPVSGEIHAALSEVAKQEGRCVGRQVTAFLNNHFTAAKKATPKKGGKAA